MKKYIKTFESHNSEKSEKDLYWDKNYQVLIQIVENFCYDQWVYILDNDEDSIQATMDQTLKHKALTLLTLCSIEELDELIEDHLRFLEEENE